MSVPIINGNIDTNITQWSEGGADDSPQAFVLRVFFNKDEQYKEQIGEKQRFSSWYSTTSFIRTSVIQLF